MNSKKLSLQIVTLLFIMFAVLPATSFAKNDSQNGKNSSKTAVASASTFCQNFPQTLTLIQDRIKQKQQDISKERAKFAQDLQTKRTQDDAKLNKQRADSDAELVKSFAAAEAKAKTAAQKQAIKTFKTAVNQAITARRAAISKAIAEYRQGLDGKISVYKKESDTINASFAGKLNQAAAVALNDCKTGMSPAESRTKFEFEVKALLTKYENDRSSLDKISQEVKQLSETKKQALDKAQNDFKAAITKATAQLKKDLAAK